MHPEKDVEMELSTSPIILGLTKVEPEMEPPSAKVRHIWDWNWTWSGPTIVEQKYRSRDGGDPHKVHLSLVLIW